jgi:hypothetical protein
LQREDTAQNSRRSDIPWLMFQTRYVGICFGDSSGKVESDHIGEEARQEASGVRQNE